MLIRRLAMILLAATMAAAFAACDAGDQPTAETVTSGAAKATEPTAIPDEEPWRDKYNDEQLEAYEAALSRWEGFEDRVEPIWEDGTVTPRARAIFQTYFTESASQVMLARQRELEFNKIKTFGRANVLWSKPSRVSEDAARLELRQCVDLSSYRGEREGEPLPKTKWANIPNIRVIAMTKPEGSPWLIESYGDPDGKKQRCDA